MLTIHSLTIENVRAIEHLHLDGLPDTGVIVVHGPNEEGKSTILDALNLVLTEKHTAGGQKIRKYKPVHRDEAPEVTLHATVGPVTFSIRKRWLSRRRSELTITAPQAANYTGGDADAKLDEILSQHLDMNLLETLFLRQEDQGDAIAAAGIPTLSSALAGNNDESGENVDISEDDALMEAVFKEYTQFFTDAGNPKKLLKDSESRLEEAAQQREDAENALAELQVHVDQMADNEAIVAECDRILPAALEDSTHAQQAWEKSQEVEEKVSQASEVVTRAEKDVEAAKSAQSERSERAQEVSDLAEKIERQKPIVAEAKEKAEAEAAALKALSDEAKSAREERQQAAQAVKAAKEAVELGRNSLRKEEVAGVLDELATFDSRLEALHEKLPDKIISAEDITALEEATNELAVATALRDTVVPKLEFQAATPTDVVVDGVAQQVDEEIYVVALQDGTTIQAGDITAVFRGGGTSTQDVIAQAEAAAIAVQELFESLQVSSLGEAREKKDEAAALQSEIRETQRDRTALLAGRDSDELRAELKRLEAILPEDAPKHDVADLEEELAQAEALREEKDERIDSLESQMEPYQEQKYGTKLVEERTRLENLEENHQAVVTKLAQLEEEVPAEELARRVAAAEETHVQAVHALKEVEAELAKTNPELARDTMEAAQARVESVKTRSREAARSIDILTGRIEQASGAAETVETARAQEEQCRHDHERLEQRAHAVQRLWEVLSKHRQAARERYAQPFADELTSLASTVFGPDVSFELTDDLEVGQRTIGEVTVPLEALSGGAKEQMAILTRFAIARLVAHSEEAEDPVAVPIVVDDALGATDQHRLQRMNTLFNRVGGDTQVIVLTCFPGRYDWIKDKTEYSMSQLKTTA